MPALAKPKSAATIAAQRRLRSPRLIAGLLVDAITREADPVLAGARGRVGISCAGQAWKGPRRPYYQWGDSGKKYHYTSGNKRSREAAKEKARRQGRAARARGYQG